MERWNLYVLRYNHSGNYYVGTTPNFENRMLIHWRRTSTKRNLPLWSAKNLSTEGFKYYWFSINSRGVSQGSAEHCEYELADLLIETIRNKISEDKKITRQIDVGNADYINNVNKIENAKDIEDKYPNIDLIDIDIEKLLKKLKVLDIESEKFEIKCLEIGSIGKYYHKYCNKRWGKVALRASF